MSNNQMVNKIKSNIAFKLMICFYKIISKKLMGIAKGKVSARYTTKIK